MQNLLPGLVLDGWVVGNWKWGGHEGDVEQGQLGQDKDGG